MKAKRSVTPPMPPTVKPSRKRSVKPTVKAEKLSGDETADPPSPTPPQQKRVKTSLSTQPQWSASPSLTTPTQSLPPSLSVSSSPPSFSPLHDVTTAPTPSTPSLSTEMLSMQRKVITKQLSEIANKASPTGVTPADHARILQLAFAAMAHRVVGCPVGSRSWLETLEVPTTDSVDRLTTGSSACRLPTTVLTDWTAAFADTVQPTLELKPDTPSYFNVQPHCHRIQSMLSLLCSLDRKNLGDPDPSDPLQLGMRAALFQGFMYRISAICNVVKKELLLYHPQNETEVTYIDSSELPHTEVVAIVRQLRGAVSESAGSPAITTPGTYDLRARAVAKVSWLNDYKYQHAMDHWMTFWNAVASATFFQQDAVFVGKLFFYFIQLLKSAAFNLREELLTFKESASILRIWTSMSGLISSTRKARYAVFEEFCMNKQIIRDLPVGKVFMMMLQEVHFDVKCKPEICIPFYFTFKSTLHIKTKQLKAPSIHRRPREQSVQGVPHTTC